MAASRSAAPVAAAAEWLSRQGIAVPGAASPAEAPASAEPGQSVDRRGARSIRARHGESAAGTGDPASDPDGDQLTGKWWQYREAGTYTGSVRIDESKSVGTFSGSFRVPADAQVGDTIHAVLEVIDNGEIPLTRYQRVIVTVR